MSLLVTGSIGIDTVEAPWGKVVDALGGSGVYFAYAASFFTPVRLVGVVGDDCAKDFLKPLQENPRIDLSGLEIRKGSKTFRWHGRYREDANLRDTIGVELNVLAEKGPEIPPQFRDSRFVFLANTHPALQLQLLEQLESPALVVADTMDLWIQNEPQLLWQLVGRIDGLVLNDSEARMMTRQSSVILAGTQIAEQIQGDADARRRRTLPGGFVVIKKGEHGSLLFAEGEVVPLPGYPARKVIDHTGAGDCFAGAMMGHLAAVGDCAHPTLHRALAYGTVTASLALEDFSLHRLRGIDRGEIDRRLAEFERMLTL